VGLERIQDIADHCGVQPSAVVRFAKHFGFSGFSEMQALFRAGIATQIAPSRSYQNRIREAVARSDHPLDSAGIAQEFVGGAVAVKSCASNAPPAHRPRLLAHASLGWRAPAAVPRGHSPCLCAATNLIQLVTGAPCTWATVRLRRGDDGRGQFCALRRRDHGPAQAIGAGATVIAITDSRMGASRNWPMWHRCAGKAVFGFRALSSTMALAQCLFIALAYRLELEYKPSGAAAR
jgi:hypothetical protein